MNFDRIFPRSLLTLFTTFDSLEAHSLALAWILPGILLMPRLKLRILNLHTEVTGLSSEVDLNNVLRLEDRLLYGSNRES